MTHEEHMEHFFNWMLMMGYMNADEIVEDGDEISEDLEKAKYATPKLYELIMSICDA